MEAAELTEALKAIAAASRLDQRLWDANDVAAYLKLSADHTRKHILTRRDFPNPCELPGKGGEPIKRWRAVDVRDWAERWRKA